MLMSIDGGIGLSSPLEETPQLPFLSRYLMLDNAYFDTISDRLPHLKRLLELPGNVVQLDFLETHPLIRSLDAYRIEPSANLNPNQNP